MFDHLKVDSKTQEQRLAVCAKCEHNKLNICTKCGCILRLKTQWATTKCPAGKWGPVKK